jgi:hypothetical protein
MEREQALNRVVELAFKWQQKHEWAAAFKAADRFRKYRDKGTERFDNLSDERHSQVIAAHNEFCAMENLLRQHAPQFLQLVPGVNFFTDSAADHTQQIQNVKQLEGAVRAMLVRAAMLVEQTVNQTIESVKTDESQTKSDSDKKPWSELATDLKNRWFSEMRRRKQWIPRRRFLSDFLNGKEGSRDKWKELSEGTEDRRFQDHPEEWKAEADALKASLKGIQKNRR